MKSYRELEIYVDSKRLAIEVHNMSLTLPKFELYEEGSQVRRLSKAVCGLIVEGYGRRKYKGEFIKYLIYSQAECDETLTHLEFLVDTNSLTDKTWYEKSRNEYEILSKKINRFTKWVKGNWNDFSGKAPESSS